MGASSGADSAIWKTLTSILEGQSRLDALALGTVLNILEERTEDAEKVVDAVPSLAGLLASALRKVHKLQSDLQMCESELDMHTSHGAVPAAKRRWMQAPTAGYYNIY